MSDYAMIQLVDDNTKQVSPVLYLMSGSDAGNIIRKAGDHRCRYDIGLGFARLAAAALQEAGGEFASIKNADKVLTIENTNGGAGIFIVHINTGQVEAFGGYGTPFNYVEEENIASGQSAALQRIVQFAGNYAGVARWVDEKCVRISGLPSNDFDRNTLCKWIAKQRAGTGLKQRFLEDESGDVLEIFAEQ